MLNNKYIVNIKRRSEMMKNLLKLLLLIFIVGNTQLFAKKVPAEVYVANEVLFRYLRGEDLGVYKKIVKIRNIDKIKEVDLKNFLLYKSVINSYKKEKNYSVIEGVYLHYKKNMDIVGLRYKIYLTFGDPFVININKFEVLAIEKDTVKRKSDKKLYAYFQVGTKYNNNAASIPDDIKKMPTTISSKGDASLFYNIGARYYLTKNSNSKSYLKLNFRDTRYRHLSTFNNQSLSLGYGIDFNRYPFIPSFSINKTYYRLDGDMYNHKTILNPSLTYKHTKNLALELDYRFSYSRYIKNEDAKNDADSKRHYISIGENLKLNSLILQGYNTYFSINVNKTYNYADGDDYDYKDYGFGLYMRQNFDYKMSLSLYKSYNKTKYSNPDSQTNDGIIRKDHYNYWNIKLNREFRKNLTAYISYQKSKIASNISGYRYKNRTYACGIRFKF